MICFMDIKEVDAKDDEDGIDEQYFHIHVCMHGDRCLLRL